jgi:hypothetical protein
MARVDALMSKRSNAIGKRKKPPARAAASVKNSYTSPSRIALQHRRNEALNYRRQGYSFAAIASQMKAPISTVHGWVVEGLNAIPRENAQQVLKMTLEQIEEMLASIYASAAEGDLPAQQAALNLLRERAKLLGLYPDERKQAVGVNLTYDGDKPQTTIHLEFIQPTPRPDDDDVLPRLSPQRDVTRSRAGTIHRRQIQRRSSTPWPIRRRACREIWAHSRNPCSTATSNCCRTVLQMIYAIPGIGGF